jgi:hypothetical protein
MKLWRCTVEAMRKEQEEEEEEGEDEGEEEVAITYPWKQNLSSNRRLQDSRECACVATSDDDDDVTVVVT